MTSDNSQVTRRRVVKTAVWSAPAVAFASAAPAATASTPPAQACTYEVYPESISYPLEAPDFWSPAVTSQRQSPHYRVSKTRNVRTLTMVTRFVNGGTCPAPVGTELRISVGATDRQYFTAPEVSDVRVASYPRLVSTNNGIFVTPDGGPYETTNKSAPYDVIRRQKFTLATPLPVGAHFDLRWEVDIYNLPASPVNRVSIPVSSRFNLTPDVTPDLNKKNDFLALRGQFTIQYTDVVGA